VNVNVKLVIRDSELPEFLAAKAATDPWLGVMYRNSDNTTYYQSDPWARLGSQGLIPTAVARALRVGGADFVQGPNWSLYPVQGQWELTDWSM
jgi:hypothetical protein